MTYTERFLNYLETLPEYLIYLLLGLSSFLENIFPPLPGDTITAFGALLVGIGGLSFFGVYLATTLGSLTGFLFLFRLGGYLGRRFFVKINIRFFKEEDINKAEKWFGKYGYYLVAINRFFPGIRSAIAVAGGILHLKANRVLVLALISCTVWNLLWMLAGYGLGSNWATIKIKLSELRMKYSISLAILLGLFVVFVIIWKWTRKRKSRISE